MIKYHAYEVILEHRRMRRGGGGEGALCPQNYANVHVSTNSGKIWAILGQNSEDIWAIFG